MKKSLLVVALALASIAMAQPRGTAPRPPRMGGEGMENYQRAIKDSLRLTPPQAAKYDSINAKYNAQTQELFAGSGLEREQRRSAMENINAARSAELQQVLTAEQFKKYTAISQQRGQEQRQGGPRGGRGRGGPPAN